MPNLGEICDITRRVGRRFFLFESEDVTFFEACAIIIAAFVCPAGLSYLLSKTARFENHQRFHEIGIAVFLQMGVIFAVIVAFVFTNVWDQFEAASNAVNRESADLQNMADRAAYLPPYAAAAVRQALKEYMISEAQYEWPAMARRTTSDETVKAFTNLFGTVAAISPDNALADGTRQNLFHLIRDVREQRQVRLFQIETNVPEWLWIVLIGFSSVLVAFVMVSRVGHPIVQSIFVGVFASFLATILVTIHLFDYPFEGSIRIPIDSIVSTIHHVDDIPVAAQQKSGN